LEVLWHRRNVFIFDQTPILLKNTIERIKELVDSTTQGLKFSLQETISMQLHVPSDICWCPPSV